MVSQINSKKFSTRDGLSQIASHGMETVRDHFWVASGSVLTETFDNKTLTVTRHQLNGSASLLSIPRQFPATPLLPQPRLRRTLVEMDEPDIVGK